VIIMTRTMPTQEAFQQLREALAKTRGDNDVILRTPQGDVPFPRLDGGYGITPGDEPMYSVLLGGAMVSYDLDSVDTAGLADGLNL
jgi:hypothetical protein